MGPGLPSRRPSRSARERQRLSTETAPTAVAPVRYERNVGVVDDRAVVAAVRAVGEVRPQGINTRDPSAGRWDIHRPVLLGHRFIPFDPFDLDHLEDRRAPREVKRVGPAPSGAPILYREGLTRQNDLCASAGW